MGKDDGVCPQCGAENSYNIAVCRQCSEELPWANWVTAREGASPALGATPGYFSRASGQSLSEGSGLLGLLTPRMLLTVLAIFLALGAVGYGFSRVSAVVSSANGRAPGGAAGGPGGGLVQKFRESNPTVRAGEHAGADEP